MNILPRKTDVYVYFYVLILKYKIAHGSFYVYKIQRQTEFRFDIDSDTLAAGY